MAGEICALCLKKSSNNRLLFFTIVSAIILMLPSSSGQKSTTKNNTEISDDIEKIQHKINELKQMLTNIIKEADYVKKESYELNKYIDSLTKQNKTDNQPSGHFEPPQVDKNKMLKLLNKIKEVQDNITKLHTDLNNQEGDINDVKERTASIEQDIDNIIIQIDNEKRETNQSFEQYDGLVANLTSSYNKLVNELTKRLSDMEEKNKELIVPQLIDAIINNNYYSARNLINQVSEEQLKSVVNEVYNKNQNSLYVLSTSVGGIKKLYIYEALVGLVVNENTDSYCDYMKLIHLLEYQIILSNNYDSDKKSQASVLLDRVVNRYKDLLNEPYENGAGWHCNIDTFFNENPIRFIQSCYGYVTHFSYQVNFNGKEFTCTVDSYSDHGFTK